MSSCWDFKTFIKGHWIRLLFSPVTVWIVAKLFSLKNMGLEVTTITELICFHSLDFLLSHCEVFFQFLFSDSKRFYGHVVCRPRVIRRVGCRVIRLFINRYRPSSNSLVHHTNCRWFNGLSLTSWKRWYRQKFSRTWWNKIPLTTLLFYQAFQAISRFWLGLGLWRLRMVVAKSWELI
jgi:hypothetical protein